MYLRPSGRYSFLENNTKLEGLSNSDAWCARAAMLTTLDFQPLLEADSLVVWRAECVILVELGDVEDHRTDYDSDDVIPGWRKEGFTFLITLIAFFKKYIHQSV